MGLTVKFAAPWALLWWSPVALLRCLVLTESTHWASRYGVLKTNNYRLHWHHLRLTILWVHLWLAILGLVHLHLWLSILGRGVLWLVHLALKLIVHNWLHRLLLVKHGLIYRLLILIEWLLRLILQLNSIGRLLHNNSFNYNKIESAAMVGLFLDMALKTFLMVKSMIESGLRCYLGSWCLHVVSQYKIRRRVE